MGSRLKNRNMVKKPRPVKKYDFSERVNVYGASKRRWRCPKCYRAIYLYGYRDKSYGSCEEHGMYAPPYPVKPIDLKKASYDTKRIVVELELTDLFSNRFPQKKQWTLKQIHDKTGLTLSYLKNNTNARFFKELWGVTIKPSKPKPKAI